MTVDYATANAGATAGADYTAESGTLIFAPGETVKNVVVDITDDADAEPFERLALDLSRTPAARPSSTATGLAVIGASDATAVAQPRISVSDVIVGEDDGYVDMVVSLSAPGQNPVSVHFATSNGTANAQSPFYDYATSSGTLNFAPGETTKVVRLQILDGTSPEDFESFNLSLDTPVNATIAKATATIGIADDDGALPVLWIDDVTLPEGNAGTTAFDFTITRSGDTSSTSSVKIVTANDPRRHPLTTPPFRSGPSVSLPA